MTKEFAELEKQDNKFMTTILNTYQQEIFDSFIKVVGSRTNGHENDIKTIILTANRLIKEMEANGDLNYKSIRDNLLNCQDNIGILYKIFEKIKHINENEPSTIYLMLIMYSHWCESLRYLFNDFVSQNYKPYNIKIKDIEKWFKVNKKDTISLNEVRSIVDSKKKDENSITLSDFKTVFSTKYKFYYKELFKGRLCIPLRNAIAHNQIKIDSVEKTIEFYYPEKNKKVKLKFTNVFDLHDTFTMIYFCIVKELVVSMVQFEIEPFIEYVISTPFFRRENF